MSAGGAGRRGRTLLAFLAALLAAAFTLRPQIIGVGPLLPRIQADLAIPHGVAGLLATIPVLCMGLFSPLAPVVADRLGPRRGIAVCLTGVAVFGLARALAPSVGVLLALTVAIGVALGLAGALLPVAVKVGAPERPAVATGAYAAGIQLGAAASAVAAVPLARSLGDWRGALAVFSAVTFALVALWWVAGARAGGSRHRVGGTRRLPLRSGLAWLIAVFFAVHTMLYYGINAWLPAYMIEHGWEETTAGAQLAVMNLTGLVGSLSVPWLADRHGTRRAYLGPAALGLGTLLLALLVRPDLGWLLVPPVGLCLGVLFVLTLTLPLDVAGRVEDVGAVAALMLGVGYVLAAFAPAALGAARDVAGTFRAALWVLVAVTAVLCVIVVLLSPARIAGGVRGSG